MNEISDWMASKSIEFWVIVAIAFGLVCWFIWNRLVFARDSGKEQVSGEFPFATQNTYSGGNPLQGLQDRLNQLEDILRQVYKKLNDRHRELEQTVTSLEAAMASLEKPATRRLPGPDNAAWENFDFGLFFKTFDLIAFSRDPQGWSSRLTR